MSTPPGHGPPQHGGGAPHGGSQRVYHDMGASGFGGSPEMGGWASDELTTPQVIERQQQFWTPRSQRHREQEVTQMQSTLAEIGQMFAKFGSVVAEQGELIHRIDDNTEAALGHIGEAHTQILKYQRTMRGNRGLMLKVFGVLFFFVIVYGTVYR